MREIAEPNIVMRVEVGSTVHGCSIDGSDDIDHMGVCIEPPHYVVGLGKFEQWIYRDALERQRVEIALHPELAHTLTGQPKSMPGDLDLIVYSLRKWCRMALKGNPTVLMLLYSPKIISSLPIGEELRKNAPAFVSKRVGRAFIGYMRQQRGKLLGERGGKDVNRPELVEKFGFDTKFAYHMLRLGYQGLEFMTTGAIELPMPVVVRDRMIAVRQGKFTLAEVEEESFDLEAKLEHAINVSGLPEVPAEMIVDQFIMDAYQEHWGWFPDASVRMMAR